MPSQCSPTTTPLQHFLHSLGRVHESVHGDGTGILARILTTCEQMLVDRGCVSVTRVDDVGSTIESGSAPAMQGVHADGSRTCVYIHADDKVGIKFARAVLEMNDGEASTNNIVIVSLDGPTPFTRKECEGRNVQFMLTKDVCVNKTRHHLVPKHVPVDDPPPGIGKDSLPKIMDSDPIVQYYNFKKGTILRMQRVWGGHETIPYFRVVAAAQS